MNYSSIGIDAGGTLVKMATLENSIMEKRTFPSSQMNEVVNWLSEYAPTAEICVTGGKHQLLAKQIMKPVTSIVEFDATCKGVQLLARQNNLLLEKQFILANIGTGTSIHHIVDGKQERIGGTGVGGGTLMGLAYLLSGIADYNQLVQTAAKGKRDGVDITVKDIFEGITPPIPENLTASNFGNVHRFMDRKPSEPDILASIIGLIAETVVTICCQAAHRFDTNSIVYIGSTFRSNLLLKEMIEEYTIMKEKKPIFLEDGEFSGAVGALLTLP
ncbi:type II pantothenate kinase [Bacillus spongiae]|uniref:Type II pantothenate kinase n=1 Tax=Bacillus spongiae TaxID=2683610 RepID=A0ABU8HD69_9BACI